LVLLGLEPALPVTISTGNQFRIRAYCPQREQFATVWTRAVKKIWSELTLEEWRLTDMGFSPLELVDNEEQCKR
jgi:hypothetical protein